MRRVRYIVVLLVAVLFCSGAYAQNTTSSNPHITKRYNIFFRVNNATIDENFKTNKSTLAQMRNDIASTLELDGALPDSLIICSTASPDGRTDFNKRLAESRAMSTKKFLLETFPEFKDAHISIQFQEEDWGGLMHVLTSHPEFPQREEMMAIINDTEDFGFKETQLRALKKGWDYLVNNYIYTLRNSSITLSVVMTDTSHKGKLLSDLGDEKLQKLEYPQSTLKTSIFEDPSYRKTIFAVRTNLLMPGFSVGLEFPIYENWSIGLNYNYPWAVAKNNTWCVENLSWFVDAKYWFTNSKTRWSATSRLKGHGLGLYAGTGYYDFQNSSKGSQGEYIDFGIDYVYALPVANDKLRFEFNLGIG